MINKKYLLIIVALAIIIQNIVIIALFRFKFHQFLQNQLIFLF